MDEFLMTIKEKSIHYGIVSVDQSVATMTDAVLVHKASICEPNICDSLKRTNYLHVLHKPSSISVQT